MIAHLDRPHGSTQDDALPAVDVLIAGLVSGAAEHAAERERSLTGIISSSRHQFPH